jgi:hypothetical protein
VFVPGRWQVRSAAAGKALMIFAEGADSKILYGLWGVFYLGQVEFQLDLVVRDPAPDREAAPGVKLDRGLRRLSTRSERARCWAPDKGHYVKPGSNPPGASRWLYPEMVMLIASTGTSK